MSLNVEMTMSIVACVRAFHDLPRRIEKVEAGGRTWSLSRFRRRHMLTPE